MAAGQGDSWSLCSHSQGAAGECSILFIQYGTPASEMAYCPTLGEGGLAH